MTPTDQHADQQLTRRQMREIRLTGATMIVTPEAAAASAALAKAETLAHAEVSDVVQSSPEPDETVEAEEQAEVVEVATAVEQAEAAEAAVEPEAVEPVEPVAPARTRRQAREFERIRTASIPVITTPPEESAHEEFEPETDEIVPEPLVEPKPAFVAEPIVEDESVLDVVEAAPEDIEETTIIPELVAEVPEEDADDVDESVDVPAPVSAATVEATEPFSEPIDEPAEEEHAPVSARSQAPILRPSFGSELLGAPSFDDLITRSSTSSGSTGSAHALILTEGQTMPPLTAPVTSTGQIMLTGTFALPEGLGSQGHAPGIADGKDVDAVLIDGELPAQSSPTPIAATAAVSQAKTPVEMIRPPAPEKSNKLVIVLAITAGILSIAAIGFTIYVVTTGKF